MTTTKKKTTKKRKPDKRPKPLDVSDVQERIAEIYRQAVCDIHQPAIDGLCAILDQTAVLVTMAADQTKRPEFSKQVAISAQTLTQELEEITKKQTQQIKGVAGRFHHWPVRVDASGNMRDNDLAVKIRGLGLGRAFPFRVGISFKEDYYETLKFIFKGGVEDYESKSFLALNPAPDVERWTQQNADEATTAMTDYAMRAFDVLFDGRKRWDEDTFARRFPIRSWMDIPKRRSILCGKMGIRGAVRNAVKMKVKLLFEKSPEKLPQKIRQKMR